MPTLTQRESIILGKVLEKAIEPMLSSKGIEYRFSEPYEELLTRPDYLIYSEKKPIASMAVTCTQDNQTMNKKRWRYIDEVFQLKSYFGPDFIVINCEFGDPSAYMQSEMNLSNAFFDGAIYIYNFERGQEFLETAIEIVKGSHSSAEELAYELVHQNVWISINIDFHQKLEEILSNRTQLAESAVLRNVWVIESAGYRTKLERIRQQRFHCYQSYLRYFVKGGLIAGKENMSDIFSAVKNDTKISKAVQSACERAGFECTTRIGGTFISDIKLKQTIDAGMTLEIYQEIEKRLLSYTPLKYVIRDIQSPDIVEQMAIHTIDLLSTPDKLKDAFVDAFKHDDYCGIQHDRTWLLDMVLIYLDVSTNYLNRLFIQNYGRDVIATKMEHYISKTDCGRNLFADPQFLHEFSQNLTELVSSFLPHAGNTPSRDTLVEKYIAKKISSLGNQPFVNPMHRYVEIIFDQNNLEYHKNSISCAITSLEGIPESMGTIHEVYQIKIAGYDIWIKAIAGYDGVKDKTREMAARGRLLQYDSPSSAKRDAKLVFVCDGNWTEDLRRLLMLSGWKHIIPVFELDSFIKGVQSGTINL